MTKLVDSLPFVDGIPDDFQQRINWIKNTEPLNGASTRYGNDGELNRASVQIQKNVVQVHNDLNNVGTAVENIQVDVDQIKKSLEITGSSDAIEQVYINKKNIEKHDGQILKLEEDTEKLRTDLDFLEEDVGVYDSSKDDYYRTVRDNIVWVKREIGAYPGQDVNGQPKQDAPGSGMKYRIINNASAIVKHDERIQALEDAYNDSDVGSLTIEVNDLRKEVGPKSGATSASIYARLVNNADAISAANNEIFAINQAIDFTNPVKIGARTTKLENDYRIVDATLNSAQTGLVPRVNNIDARLGSSDKPDTIEGKISSLSTDQGYISDVVGRDTSSGLQGQVAWINQQVGIVPGGQPIPPGSILARMTNVEGMQNSQQSAIQDIQVELGNNSEGLKGSVFTLQTQMNGDFSSENPVQRDGVYATVVELQDKFVTAVTDVEQDGAYLRKRGEWFKKPSSIGEFSKEDFTVDLSSDALVNPNSLVAASFNAGIRIVDDIIVDDDGVFCVETDTVIEASDSDKAVQIVILVNNIEVFTYSLGVKAVTGEKLLKTKKLIKFSSGDAIKIVYRAASEESKVPVSIKSLDITIHPAV
ncbi:fibritin neck whiskers protein [Klebsiella phage KMI11]|nr:fibritin neck whiskers protein [Klebsiella phage KMI11]